MKGDTDMTEPVRLWSGENGRRAAHDWAAPRRPQLEPPAPEQAPAPGMGAARGRPRSLAGGCGRARPARWPPPCSWLAAWRWGI
jgi:hypothetical protein